MNLLKPILIALAIGMLNPHVGAANYYVSTRGSDADSGTESSPFRTIQKAVDAATGGDTVIVFGGDYGEYVSTKAGGTPSRPLTIQAFELAKLRALRILHPHVLVDGFTFTGAQNIWGAHIRLEPSANHSVIRNCFIGPGVFGISTGMVFNASSQTLYNAAINWAALGFVPGGRIFTGASGLEKYWYANHDKAWTITEVSEHSMRLTGGWVPETNSFAWAPVYAGGNSAGIEGVSFIIAGNSSATNVQIIGNTFSNLFGPTITLHGANHLVANNKFTKLNSYYGLRPNGHNILIVSNLWINCENFIQYTGREINNVPHPEGPSWYDYQVGFLHSTAGGTNIHFVRNWVENVHNPLGQINERPDAYGFYIRSNVFVGVRANLSGGRNGLYIENNTFYKVGYGEDGRVALSVGGNSEAKPSTNIVIRKNMFLDVGDHQYITKEGFYSLVNSTNSVADMNFVAGPETTGWNAKTGFMELNGINGGNPMLQDPSNPRGLDGLPFTEDDGLRPTGLSPIASSEWGALEVAKLSGTFASFCVSSNSAGLRWHDTTAPDAAWLSMAPFERTNFFRPWFTPEALGNAPVTITFDASPSFSASALGSKITRYSWNFGDGHSVDTEIPFREHTFRTEGSFRVSLTVVDSLGNERSCAKVYRVNSSGRPSTPQALKIVFH